MTDLYKGSSFYQYHPLPSEKFMRLLELYPGQANDNIDCTLRQTELENIPKYEAISYAWGDATNKVDVLCDGKIMMVTRSLKDALLRLRLKDGPRIIWADAICINQDDNIEKGSQVRLMGRIYGNATRVCVWLGYSTTQVEPAFEIIDEIFNRAGPTTTHTIEPLYLRSEQWSALDIFFSAAWFGRLWVVQEVYGHTCTVFYGKYEAPWKDVVKVAELTLDLSDDFRSTYFHQIGSAFSVLNINSAGDQPLESDIFDFFRHLSCSDPRDQVYALLSFPSLSELRPLIQPDYSKSVAEVFEEATVRVFTSCQNIGLLSSIEHDCTIDEEWPSWIPRWDRLRTTQILHKYASGRTRLSLPRIKCMPTILISEGVRISTLSWCGVVIRNKESKMDSLKQPFQDWLSEYAPKIANSSDPLLIDVAMTLTCGLDLDSNCPPLDPSQFRLDLLAFLVDILPSLDVLGTAQNVSQILAEEGLTGDPARFYAAAIRGCKNKRFLCTQNGEFGIGPQAAQTGDHVVLLYGSNAPCVLRPKGLYYQFVGECYLHQHMHGEVIEMAAEGLLPIEEFEIR